MDMRNTSDGGIRQKNFTPLTTAYRFSEKSCSIQETKDCHDRAPAPKHPTQAQSIARLR